MDKEKIIREEKIKVKPVKRISIYDPWYMEHIENNTCTGAEKNLVALFQKIPVANRNAQVIIREVETETEMEYGGKQFKYSSIILMFMQYKNEVSGIQVAHAHRENKYIPSLLKKHIELACDTARFDIKINDQYEEIHTGADGYYGDFYHYKDNLAHIFEIEFDASLYSFDEIKSKAKYLFDIK